MTTKAIKAAIYALSIIATPMAANAAGDALPVCPVNDTIRLNVLNRSQLPNGAFTYFLTEPTTEGAEVKVLIDPDTSSSATDRLTIDTPNGRRGKLGSNVSLDLTMDKPTDDNEAQASVCVQDKS